MNARSSARFVGLASAAALGVMVGVALSRAKRTVFRVKSLLHCNWLGHLKT